jgi:type II secretory pathway component PulF
MSKYSDVPYKVRTAAKKFNKHRAVYYRYLASMLESSKGNTKMLTLFEKDAQRYDGKPRGVLANHWSQVYLNNGGNLAEAWQGTLPDDEISIIRVAQDAGPGALLAALSDVSRVAMLSDKVKSETIGTLMAAIIGISIALVMATVFVVFSSSKLQEVYSFIPLEEWGSNGKAFNAHAARVKDYGLYVVIGIVLVVVYFSWTVNNLVGPIRNWLDVNVALYTTIRDIKGALFLATMSTLTRKRGNVMYTLGASLTTLSQSARSPWLKWRLEEILDGMNANGATGSEAFQTNLLSEEMYFFLRDTQEARGFSEGFDETGKYVEKDLIVSIMKRMAIYRWLLLMVGVIAVVGIMGWQSSVIYEMKGVMSNFYSSQ